MASLCAPRSSSPGARGLAGGRAVVSTFLSSCRGGAPRACLAWGATLPAGSFSVSARWRVAWALAYPLMASRVSHHCRGGARRACLARGATPRLALRGLPPRVPIYRGCLSPPARPSLLRCPTGLKRWGRFSSVSHRLSFPLFARHGASPGRPFGLSCVYDLT